MTGWSLIIWESGLVTLHALENNRAASVGQNHLFCYCSRGPLLSAGNRGGVFTNRLSPLSAALHAIRSGARTRVWALSYLVLCSLPPRFEPCQVVPSNTFRCSAAAALQEVETVLSARRVIGLRFSVRTRAIWNMGSVVIRYSLIIEIFPFEDVIIWRSETLWQSSPL